MTTEQERVVMLRKKAGLSQSQLAKRAGLKASAINMIENGQRAPRLTTAIAISNALHISLDVYAGLKDYSENEITLRSKLIRAEQKLEEIKKLAT